MTTRNGTTAEDPEGIDEVVETAEPGPEDPSVEANAEGEGSAANSAEEELPQRVDAGDGRGEYVYRRRSWVRRAATATLRAIGGPFAQMGRHVRSGMDAATAPDDESAAQRYPGWVRSWWGKTLLVVATAAVLVAWMQIAGMML